MITKQLSPIDVGKGSRFIYGHVTPRTVYAVMSIVISSIITIALLFLIVGPAPVAAADAKKESAGGSDYCAIMDDSVGLYEGNPVTQMGIKIGTVDKIVAQGESVKVYFSLNSGRNYPADVTAVTRSKSLLADRSLELVGNYENGPILQPGICIQLENTLTPKPISDVAGSTSEFLEELIESDVDIERLLKGADASISGTGDSARSMFENAAEAARHPDQFVADIGSSIRDMAPLSEEALDNMSEILSLVDQAPDVSELGVTLFYDVAKFCRGIGWTIALLYDIETTFGAEISELLDGNAPLSIRATAEDAPVWSRQLQDLIPSVSGALDYQTARRGGMSGSLLESASSGAPVDCSDGDAVCSEDVNRSDVPDVVNLVLDGAIND